MSIQQLAKNQQNTADNFSDEPDTLSVLKRGSERLLVRQGPDIIYTRDTTNDTKWGQFNWNAENWDGTYNSDLVIARVVNHNNIFIEQYTTTLLIATASGSYTEGQYDLTAGEHIESYPIFLNQQNVLAATMDCTYTGDAPTFYLSVNGGSNWEEVTNGERYTFTTPGNDLRYRIEASGTTTLTTVRVSYEV